MTGGWVEMAAVFAAFLASHALPARPPARARLVGVLGRGGYLITYSAVSLALLAWLIAAAGRAPHIPLWSWAPWQTWVLNVVMPLVCLLGAYGVAVPNPLSIGGRRNGDFNPEMPGVAGITRHPLLGVLALWATAHAVANGDLAHVLLFGGFAVFAIVGMIALDRRVQRRLGGDDWHRLARRTSLIPFAALVSGRWRPQRRPGLHRGATALLVWAAFLRLHPAVIGVSPFPTMRTSAIG